jgi:hypothetical protein
MVRAAARLAGGGVFVSTLLVFLVSPVHHYSDSTGTVLLSESLLYRRSFALERYFAPSEREPHVSPPVPVQMESIGAHLYSFYPPGSAILSAPLVALVNLSGVSAVGPDGRYHRAGDVRVQAILASLLMAVLALVWFATARLMLPVRMSVLVALSGALSTQVWSTASRALWSHTWQILLAALAIRLLLRAELGRGRLCPMLLGTLMAWMFIVRPTGAVPILAASAYVLWRHRSSFPIYALTGGLWAAAFAGWSLHVYGNPLPTYYRLETQGASGLAAIAGIGLGHLLSPSRGLLLYVPGVWIVAYLLLRYRRALRPRPLVGLGLAVVAGYGWVFLRWWCWWGGYSYGPRLLTDLVPWFILLGILGLRARLETGPPRAPRAEAAAGLALLALGAVLNGIGATCESALQWSSRPVDVNTRVDRLWSWRHAQFLTVLGWPLPWDYPPYVPGSRLQPALPSAEPYLWGGWSETDEGVRWVSTGAGEIVFATQRRDLERLRLRVLPVGGVPPRPVSAYVVLNGRRIGQIPLAWRKPRIVSIRVPPGLVRERNELQFRMPHLSGRVGPAVKEAGTLAVLWLELH